MKLGYEFYAPRILDEMQKEPNKSFEDTEYWRAFQKHLKSYTDKVMIQTMDSLANFPKDVLDTLIEKFGAYLGDALQGTTPVSYGKTITGVPITNIRLDSGLGSIGNRDPLQQKGSSLFEKDLMKKRQAEHEAILNPPDKQAAHRALWDKRHKDGLLEIANLVNNITASYKPSKRHKTQSSDLQLKSYIINQNNKKHLTNTSIEQIKSMHFSDNSNAFQKARIFYNKEMNNLKGFSLLIAKHLILYSLGSFQK